MKPLTFVIAEDRGPEEMGIRLALLSLRRHCPEATVFVFRPDPAPAFCQWLEGFPNVKLILRRPLEAETWNCKPQALLEVLDLGFEEAIWLDSDILLARSCAPLFADLDHRTIVVAEEMMTTPHQGSAARTKLWDLPVGRTFPITMNSCVVRVTNQHRPFLIRWKEMLANPAYLQAQKLPMGDRPFYFSGDQDALNALLGSNDFDDIPVRFLKRGFEIIHSGGGRTYSLGERLSGLGHKIPPLIHSPGSKPWFAFGPGRHLSGSFWTYHRLLLEVSPYVAFAREYRNSLGDEGKWLDHASLVGTTFRRLGFGNYALRGLLFTLVGTVLARVKSSLRKLKKFFM